jgi:hypothetical protein
MSDAGGLPPAPERFETALDGFEIILRNLEVFTLKEAVVLLQMVENGKAVIRRHLTDGGAPGSPECPTALHPVALRVVA